MTSDTVGDTSEFSKAIATGVATVSADLSVTGDAPRSVTRGNQVVYTLTVFNAGPSNATGVKLSDTLPPGATFVAATGGVTPVGGMLTFNIGNMAAETHLSFVIVVTPTAPGTLINQATVRGNESDPTANDNNAVESTTVNNTPVGADGPTVTLVQRFGFHWFPTVLVLTFDKPLDPLTAQNLANYQLVALGGAGRFIRINSVVYNPVTRTVSLFPAELLNLHHLFLLTVVGTGPTGVTDTFGNLLDGRKTGRPGSNFVTLISIANWVH
jgi:uncharacterized repeat protein (TIGR01451 family)